MAAVAPIRTADGLASLRARTLFVLWTTYGSFYFCRVNIGPARNSIQAALGLSAFEIGLVLGAVKLGYAVGQLVNGQLTERFGARRILRVGMLGSGAATLLFAATPALSRISAPGAVAAAVTAPVRWIVGSTQIDVAWTGLLPLMLLVSFANGWFQAGGWPPVVKVASVWFPVEQRGRTMGILGTSLTLGSAVAFIAVGALVHATGDWRIACVAPAALLLASSVHTSLRLRERPPDDHASLATVTTAQDAASHRMPVGEALRATIGNPRIWVLALGLFGLDAVRYGFLDWAPGHLAEVHGTGALPAALKTAVLPLAGAVGALSSGWLTDRFFQSRRAPVCALLLGAVALLTLVYRVVVDLGALPTVVTLALAGFCLFGAQILLVGTAAQDFARRGATAAAAGFVDFVGHVGAFSGDVVTGWMLKHHGWAGAITWWASAAFVAALLVATLWRARPEESKGLVSTA
jgi:MFS transporter, OPA family, glycerol-3-phosphate transporter